MSGTEGVKSVQLAAATPAPGFVVNFPGDLEWIRVQNDGPQTVTILGHEAAVLLHVLPGDVTPFHFGSREYNNLNITTDVGLTAGDIALGNIIYIHYKLKIRGH